MFKAFFLRWHANKLGSNERYDEDTTYKVVVHGAEQAHSQGSISPQKGYIRGDSIRVGFSTARGPTDAVDGGVREAKDFGGVDAIPDQEGTRRGEYVHTV